MKCALVFLALVSCAAATPTLGPCLFDGRQYSAGEEIIISHCLASMTCLGNNLYGNMVSLGGVCPDTQTRAINGQNGCLFDGHVYAPGETIMIGDCLAKMTCLGHNLYSDPVSLGGEC